MEKFIAECLIINKSIWLISLYIQKQKLKSLGNIEGVIAVENWADLVVSKWLCHIMVNNFLLVENKIVEKGFAQRVNLLVELEVFKS